MTGLTARNFRLGDRGGLRPGRFADVVMFDPQKVRDMATYENPIEMSEGIERVYINGALSFVGTRAGALAGAGRPAAAQSIAGGHGMSAEKVWDVVALGEALIEFNRRQPDERTFWMGFGGDTSNCVIAAARLGARCAYVTQVGDDDFGQELLALWRREQLATDGVRVLAGAPTGIYFVSHGADGHRFSYRRSGSAASRMTPAILPQVLIAEARWLHVSGISQAISDSARDTVACAIEIARANATPVSFDLNFRPALVSAPMALEVLRQTLPHCDLFLPSVDEIAALVGIDEPEAIVRWSHEHGARQVVLKLGARGCLVSDGSVLTALAASAVEPVDATGAGDCFAGACLAELSGGSSLVDAARLANRAAALSTQGYGAIDSLPRREALGVDGGAHRT